MPNVNLDKVIASLILAIEDSHDIESLTELKKDYLGPQSIIAQERKNLKDYSIDQKKKLGPLINQTSSQVEDLLEAAIEKATLNESINKEKKEKADISIDWYTREYG